MKHGPPPICPRCHGHYESLLHRLCEAELKLAERAAGWRLNQISSAEETEYVKAQMRRKEASR